MQQGATFYCFRSKTPQMTCAPCKSAGGDPSNLWLPPPPSGSPVANHVSGGHGDDKALASPTPRTPNDDVKPPQQQQRKIVVSVPTLNASPPLHVATVGDDIGSGTVTVGENVNCTGRVRHTAKSMKLSPRKPLFAEVRSPQLTMLQNAWLRNIYSTSMRCSR